MGTSANASLSYLDNLLVRTADEQWDVARGMELTLEALVGATAVGVVLPQPRLASYDLTGLIDTVREFLADDPTPAHKAQIGSSLRFLTFDRAQLEGMLLEPGAPPPTPLKITPPPVLGPDETDREDPFFDPASTAYDTDCKLFFRRFPLGPGATHCLVARESQADGHAYRVYSPAPSLAPFYWSETHRTWIDDAISTALPLLLALGDVPTFDVILAVNLDAPGEASTLLNSDGCEVVLYTHLQNRSETAFKQVVARQVANCFVEATFGGIADTPYASWRWVRDGLATYLSSVAFPTGDVELESLETLRQIDEGTSLTGWSSGAFVWFQYLAGRMDDEQIIDLVDSLHGSSSTEQAASLNELPGLDDLFHEFALAYTDGAIHDTSGSQLMTAWAPQDGAGTSVDNTGSFAVQSVPSLAMRRSLLVIPPDRLAHLEAPAPASGAITSSRAYGGGSWGPIETLYPPECFRDNRLLVVATNIGSDDYSTGISVTALDAVC